MFTTAHASHTLPLSTPWSQLQPRLLQTAASLGWRVLHRSETRLRFAVKISWRSWGEEVCLLVSSDSLTITSSCRCATQVYDWGKNRQNCERLTRALGGGQS